MLKNEWVDVCNGHVCHPLQGMITSQIFCSYDLPQNLRLILIQLEVWTESGAEDLSRPVCSTEGAQEKRTFPHTEQQSNRPFIVNHGPCNRLIRLGVSSDLVDLGSTYYKCRDVVDVGGIPDRDSPITCRGRAAVQTHSLPLKH